ncbi:MAG: bifunctional phosphopantothenoylcysteine decarboxylase/phosphopantothenate--cysteine ligase CoaBC [Pseudomonadota bacterium]|nr:bifunctional phosphopantothenoylcysteine decarboxylase/phosphopantothenate--cysteine ligase CoaBC [Pseudomonadota bacterium]
MTVTLHNKRILLVVSGGIAAYKALELIRRLRDKGAAVTCVLTAGGAQFVTPMALAAISGNKVYQDLWSLTDEAEMGHIQLSRQADLVLVVPASADILAKHTAGLADDLATTLLLATNRAVMVAPAMNARMWQHPATQHNIRLLQQRGIRIIGPEDGAMACGEYGPGRMSEPADILSAVEAFFAEKTSGALSGKKALVTSGPTQEPIDPVRYISNRSSGKQGHAIAAALARAGADVTLISGPVSLPDPPGVRTVHVETTQQMLDACLKALPANIAICAAAVADWRMEQETPSKIKKKTASLSLTLMPNPDILATLSRPGPNRPALVAGFAAETDNLLAHAADKLEKKDCDWILANDVSAGSGTFGGDSNTVTLLRRNPKGVQQDSWPRMGKDAVAERLVAAIADHFGSKQP